MVLVPHRLAPCHVCAAGMGELPLIGEFKGAAKDPNRLELVCLTGQVDSLAKNMGAEAAKGLVRAYL